MCMFCAAVPAVLSVGVAVRAEQRAKHKAAEARGEQPAKPLLPATPAAAAALAGVVVAAVIYHTQGVG
jgi:hypothetical protein